MRPEVVKYLQDVQQACTLLENFTRGKAFVDYQTDDLLRAGVEREFIIIGEALMQADKLDAIIAQSMSQLAQIVGFRNILVHGYALIQHRTVCGVLQNDLATLKKEVETLLSHSASP
jgi:uncharacterized protein with HEPN domain